MPHIRTKHSDAIQTTMSELTYAVAAALKKGMSLQEAQDLLAAPPDYYDGLTSLSIDDSSSPEEGRCLRIQMQETTSVKCLSHTTGLPQGLQDTSPVVINSKNAHDPRFRLKPVWLCLQGQKICKVHASLLTPNHYLLSPRQQRTILHALIPDLPDNSPFWQAMPPLRLVLTTTAYMHQTTSSYGNLYLQPKIQVNANWVPSSNPAPPTGGGSSIQVEGFFLSQKVPTPTIEMVPLLAPLFQQKLSTMHWIQEALAAHPHWHSFAQCTNPTRSVVRALQPKEISNWPNLLFQLSRLSLSLSTVAPPPCAPTYTEIPAPLPTLDQLQTYATPDISQTFSYDTYRSRMYNVALTIQEELSMGQLSC